MQGYFRDVRLMLISVFLLVCFFANVNAATNNSSQQNPTFQGWLNAFKKEASNSGISEATLVSALSDVKPIPRIIELDRNQPEFKLTFEQYYQRVVNKRRINKGRKLLKEHHALLADIEKKHGVQPRFIVALWGMETDFGRMTGGFKVIDALVTLAFDGRRSSFFRKQLIHALRIIDQGHVTAKKMTGSWAGAMGQTQFMPSTFANNAIDHDGDGRIDLWSNKGDALASGANYLARTGWKANQSWGVEVKLRQPLDEKLLGIKVRKNLSEWVELGVESINGKLLNAPGKVSIVTLSGPNNRSFMVFHNYLAIMDWNKSTHFATSVGLLADAIGEVN
jgi:membrane-bound lytic murein transglycosylase B